MAHTCIKLIGAPLVILKIYKVLALIQETLYIFRITWGAPRMKLCTLDEHVPLPHPSLLLRNILPPQFEIKRGTISSCVTPC